MTAEVSDYPLHLCHLLIVNEIEGKALTGYVDKLQILQALGKRFPNTAVLLTLGAEGAYLRKGEKEWFQPARKVNVVDTTAAGDTFIGYFLAAMLDNYSIEYALLYATEAAALCVTRHGAMDSIPLHNELNLPKPN